MWGFGRQRLLPMGHLRRAVTAYFNTQDKEGSISIADDGTVTRSSPAWPTWASDATLYLDDDKAYRVVGGSVTHRSSLITGQV